MTCNTFCDRLLSVSGDGVPRQRVWRATPELWFGTPELWRGTPADLIETTQRLHRYHRKKLERRGLRLRREPFTLFIQVGEDSQRLPLHPRQRQHLLLSSPTETRCSSRTHDRNNGGLLYRRQSRRGRRRSRSSSCHTRRRGTDARAHSGSVAVDGCGLHQSSWSEGPALLFPTPTYPTCVSAQLVALTARRQPPQTSAMDVA